MNSDELRKIIQLDLTLSKRLSDQSQDSVAIAQRIATAHGIIGMTNLVRMVIEVKASCVSKYPE